MIILKKLFVISLADIAGAIIATARRVTPIEFIAAITTIASIIENNNSILYIFIPYTFAVSLSNIVNNRRF